jgi:hypothetical protein
MVARLYLLLGFVALIGKSNAFICDRPMRKTTIRRQLRVGTQHPSSEIALKGIHLVA